MRRLSRSPRGRTLLRFFLIRRLIRPSRRDRPNQYIRLLRLRRRFVGVRREGGTRRVSLPTAIAATTRWRSIPYVATTPMHGGVEAPLGCKDRPEELGLLHNPMNTQVAVNLLFGLLEKQPRYMSPICKSLCERSVSSWLHLWAEEVRARRGVNARHAYLNRAPPKKALNI